MAETDVQTMKSADAVYAAEPVRVTTTFQRIEAIGPRDVIEMHSVFVKFYENADFATFACDLAKKDGAFIVRDKSSGRVKGFSTLTRLKVKHPQGEALGIFSGDTILEPDVWGGAFLHNAFTRYVLKEKLRNLGRPIYWFLISKGYKTYLLMANNFERYYPRHDQPDDPYLKGIMEAYCTTLYPDNYRPERGTLEFGDGAQCLRGDVAPITEGMRRSHPKIRFFEERNPNWQQGTELPCVGEITVPLIAKAAVKQFRKRLAA